MRVLFCKISNMKYYKGVCDNDKPEYGGSYVKENGYGHEEYNFQSFEKNGPGEAECLGFVEPKSNRGKRNTLHIENIEGCSAMKEEECVEDVLVIWCAKQLEGHIAVVGWYKHACVWRNLQDWTYIHPDGEKEYREFNVRAKAEDCVLIPHNRRRNNKWEIKPASYTKAYGFGQSMVWYPTQPEAKVFLNKLIENIENYTGDNHLNEYPEM